jgi:mannose-6-phosphate isomerase-like protein (cupin superfamily)
MLLSRFACAALLFASSASAQSQPPPAAPVQPPPARPAATPAQPPRPAATSFTMTVEATDKSGNGIGDVSVGVNGPVDRSGTTGKDGSIAFRSMRAGTYRLRFEREGFTTLERELVTRAGAPVTVSVALTAAPVKPVPKVPEPAPAPAPAPPPPVRSPSRAVEPRSLSIPDFLDTNLIGGEPQRRTLLGCAEGGTTTLLQVRDPLSDQNHADADLVLYVVAGSGTVRVRNQDTRLQPGHFAMVPRGMSYGLRRDGRNPLIVLSVLAGAPCVESGSAGK